MENTFNKTNHKNAPRYSDHFFPSDRKKIHIDYKNANFEQRLFNIERIIAEFERSFSNQIGNTDYLFLCDRSLPKIK